MPSPLSLHPDRLLPTDKNVRSVAQQLYQHIQHLPIVSPHGHTDPSWFANNTHFDNPVNLLIQPDHYVFRMLYSQGIQLEQLGISSRKGNSLKVETDDRKIWRLFADNYFLFRGTPSRTWLDSVFYDVFDINIKLDASTADLYFDTITEQLRKESFRPRALFKRFNIEVIATTESPLDNLQHHKKLAADGWGNKVITTYRPDNVTDPDYEGFSANLIEFALLTGEDTQSWQGYLNAHRKRRQFFIEHGATASDHSFPSAQTADLNPQQCNSLFDKIICGNFSRDDAALFRAQMLTEMATMSIDDGLVMQLHCGPYRNHNTPLFKTFGRDKGGDIPQAMEYVHALQPLLAKHGNNPDLSIILFTLDESTYARELAPLAGHYPALKLGPAWWFQDSPEGMRRFRQQITETAGFYNTVGFNDDTRAFFSIPSRHDVARRMDASFLAELVCDHRLNETEAFELAEDLTYKLVKKAYRFN